MGLTFRSRVALMSILLALAPAPVSATIDVIFQDGFQFGFHVQVPEITLAAGEEATYCYYFRTPNTSAFGIRRWTAHMLPGMGHAILYTTNTEHQPPGTLTNSNCSAAPGGEFGKWQFAAYVPDDTLVFPADDGTATPLAAEIGVGQFAFVQMYALNAGVLPFTTSVLIGAEALDPATMYTKSAAYVTYNGQLSIPPMGTSSAELTCPTPVASKFWYLTTRTHRFATLAKIINSGSDVVVSTDWQHPNVASFGPPAFLTFASGLTYHCDYFNSNNFTLHSGDSESTDEVCMGIGYFFPADSGGKFCFNSTGPL